MSRHLILRGCFLFLATAPLEEARTETQLERRRLAEQLVAEALHCEIYGEAEERSDLLRAATAADPQSAAARWHQGYVWQDGAWILSEDAPQKYAADRRWVAYERARQQHPETLEGHLALAAWCRERDLPDQERAHLNRVLQFNNDHAFARERLGFQQIGGTWYASQDVTGAQRQQEATRRSLAAWSEPLRQIFGDLDSRSERIRAAALERLQKIDTVEAVPALERLVSPTSEANAHRALEVLGRIDELEATRSLARHAVMAPWESVRTKAAELLHDRPLEEYVPTLLSEMYTPVTTIRQVAPGPGGRLLYRHAFVREGQGQRELMVLDTAYTRVSVSGGDGRETLGRALLNLWTSAATREFSASQQNDMQAELNTRIGAALKIATQANVVDAPENWWRWWNEVNEVFVPEKPVSTIRREQQVRIVDRPPPIIARGGNQDSGQAEEEDESSQRSETGQNGAQRPRARVRSLDRVESTDPRLVRRNNPVIRVDCLAAGTLVWTLTGPLPVENLRAGDMVLAQNTETGELTYKPVLRTTVRPKGNTIRVTAESETIAASGGHLFWVSGEGWVKARRLNPGQELHGRDGPVRVSAVESGEEVETYNLEVADFHNYFIGEAKILCHDNTVRQPTTAVVPGLSP